MKYEQDVSLHLEEKNDCLELMTHLKAEHQQLQKKQRKLDNLEKAVSNQKTDLEP